MCGKLGTLNKIFLLLISLFTLNACSDIPVEQDYFDIKGAGVNLESAILRMDSIRVGMICDCVIDDKLIFKRLDMPYKYEIYTIKKDSLIYENKFLNIGRAANEIRNPRLWYDSHHNRVYLYSLSNFEDKLFIVDVKDFNNLYNPLSWERKKLPILYTRGALGILNDTVFLNKNDTKTSDMFSLSYAGGKDNEFKCLDFQYPGEHPAIISDRLDYLFMGDLKQRPGTASFVYTCYTSPLVFIFDIINEQLQNIRYISRVLPVYKLTGDFSDPFAIADEYRSGFDTFQVTGKYIYIGYNNVTWGQIRNLAPFKGYPNSYFDRINVFDWNGNFVKRLVLDRPVDSFLVTPDDLYVYGSSMEPEKENQPELMLRFEIKE